jgi:hypothetical protein
MVGIVRNAAKTNAKHAEWLLERSWPNEYARTERIEQIGEKADEDSSLKIYYNTHGQPFSELLAFPIHFSMAQGHDSPEVTREKQRRLLGQTAKTPAQPEPEKISDAPAPSVVNKAFTGRIRPEWKGNCK